MDQIIVFLDALAIIVLVFSVLVEAALYNQCRVLQTYEDKTSCEAAMLVVFIPILISSIWLLM